MQRTPNSWSHNPAKTATLTAYSSPTTTYNSSTTAYSNVNAGLTASGKLPDVFTPVAKTVAPWNPNPAAILSLYPYDSSSHTYDSAADTYDGIVVGQDFSEQETPNVWSPL